MILWLVLIAFGLWIVLFNYRRRRMYKLASLIPGSEEELPVIGLALSLTGDTEDVLSALQRFSYNAMKLNGIIRGWLNHLLYFIIVDPVDLEMVLKNCLEKDDLHRFIQNGLGYGAGIFAPVLIWRERRKTLIPAFRPKILENFVDIFSKQSQELVKKLEPHSNKGSFSIWPFVNTYTMDSISETAMGVNLNAQNNPNTIFVKSIERLMNLICQRIFRVWLQPDWLYKILPQYKEHEDCIKKMHDFTSEVIRKKREEMKTISDSNHDADNQYDLRHYSRKTFLDLLISLSGGEKGYTDAELREEVLALILAGSDTSTTTIGFTLELLGMYPKIQEKVYQELFEVFGDSDRPLVKEDLSKLKYLERVVKETLRLFPPVPFIVRKVLEEIVLPSGRMLPAGCGVVVSIWGVHRDPKYWGPDAEVFDPDRFLPERFNLPHACNYMPFSNGPRNCVGFQFALMSIKTTLSTILRSYKVVGEKEVSNTPRIRVKLDILMKAVEEHQVALERRKRQSVSTAKIE